MCVDGFPHAIPEVCQLYITWYHTSQYREIDTTSQETSTNLREEFEPHPTLLCPVKVTRGQHALGFHLLYGLVLRNELTRCLSAHQARLGRPPPKVVPALCALESSSCKAHDRPKP